MLKKSFFGLGTPQIEYQRMNPARKTPRQIPVPSRVTLLLNGATQTADGLEFKTGDRVKTGQILSAAGTGREKVAASITGTIVSIAPLAGDFGKTYTAVTIDAEPEEEADDAFAAIAETPALASAADYLSSAPGSPPLHLFSDPEKPIRTIVVFGGNTDLLVTTNQFVIESQIDNITKGIAALKQITGSRTSSSWSRATCSRDSAMWAHALPPSTRYIPQGTR
jgi:electron transport complex protein RnfC